MSLLKKKSISVLLAVGIIVSSSSISLACAAYEDGENHISGAQPFVFSSYEKSADFYLYSTKDMNLYSSASTSSKVVGTVSPQMLKGSKRKGDYFLIDSYAGKVWVYADDHVQVREVESMNSDAFTTNNSLSLYSQPFTAYPTGQTLPAGAYSISKKAGDWFYVNSSSYSGWFTTTSGSFNNAISKLSTSKINNTPLYVQLANYSDNVRPGNPMKPKYITIHNTANTGKSANAKAHANLLSNNNNGRTASWHYTVDDRSIYQSLPLNEIGLHAGDGSGPGNRSSVAIEICENSDGDFNKAQQNAAELTAQLLHELNLPISSVKNHQFFSGKNCPSKTFSSPGGWNSFMSRVEKAYNSISGGNSSEDPISKTYYLDINSFLGDYSVDNAMQRLQDDTGWHLEKKETGDKLPVYEIETGGFVGEDNVKAAVNTIKNSTGLDATYGPNGAYVDGYQLPIFMIETGGFYGEDNVKASLKKIQDDTGWWGTYTPSKTLDNTYHIILGGFDGEESVKSALSKVQNNYGWWADYYATGEFTSGNQTPVYSIKIGNISSSSDAQSLVNKLQNDYSWWSHYYNTDNINYYSIVTGDFGDINTANEKAQFVRDNYGWYTQVKER